MRATMVLVPTLPLLLLLLLPCCHGRTLQVLRRDGRRAACWCRLPSSAIVHLARALTWAVAGRLQFEAQCGVGTH